MRFLLVDDKEETLYLFGSLLKGSGHEVVYAANGIEALEKLREDHIDMIISDILMPRMDGYGLCRECKKDDNLKQLPFVFITSSYTDKKDENFALSLGAERFIRRPIEPEEFIRIMEDVIKKQQGAAPEKREMHAMKEISYLTEYSERLTSKLEQKVSELEKEICQRRIAEDALIEHEAKYRMFLQHFQGIAFRGTLDFIPVFFHGLVEEITGYSQEDFLAGMPTWDKIIHPDDVAVIAGEIEHIRTVPLYLSKREYRIIRKDGEIRWVYEIIQNICDNSGKPVAVQGSLYDITERKCMEQERERLFWWKEGVNLLQQSLLEPATCKEKLKRVTDGIVRIFDADFCRIWLIRPGDLCERGCIHAEVREEPHVCRCRDRCLHLLASSGRYTHTDGKIHGRVPFGCYKIGLIASGEEHKFLTNNVTGDPRVHNHEWARNLGLVSFAGYQLRVPGGQTMGVLALFAKHPISEAEDAMLDGLGSTVALAVQQTAAEEALRESENKYRTLLENLPQKIFHKNRNSVYISCNKHYADDLKIQPAEIAGKTDYDFHPAELAEKYIADDKRLMEQGRCEDIEEKYRQDGQDTWVHTVKTPVLDDSGTVTGILGVFWDITERKRMEEEQSRLQEQLRQSQKLEGIGQLAGGIAHDFNNILSAIIGFGGLVQMQLQADSPLQYYINEVLAAGNRGSALTQQILAFSRKQALDVKTVDLNEIVKSIEKMLLRLMREDVRLGFVLADSSLPVMADISQIDQILINLAANARDAMPDGGELTISTSSEDMGSDFISVHGYGTAGRYALITVSDTGTGMDEATQERIFEPFFTTKETGKGTGLGLSVVYGIVKQHNGFIVVDSEPGKGTAFRVYFPLSTGLIGNERVNETIQAKGGSETILLADDDDGMRKSLARYLELSGYTVIPAMDGNDAVSKFREHANEIKLLVTDVLMPSKGGKETYDELSKIRPGLKAVFMSGHSSDVLVSKRILEEGLDFISKPFKLDEFLMKIRDVLDRKP